LAARLLARGGAWEAALAAVNAPGPWTADLSCRDLAAAANLQLGRTAIAAALARESLAEDPLDSFALSLAASKEKGPADSSLESLAFARLDPTLDLALAYHQLGLDDAGLHLLTRFYAGLHDFDVAPLARWWSAYLSDKTGVSRRAARFPAPSLAPADVELNWPWQEVSVEVLRWVAQQNPTDGLAALSLGDLLFHLGRYAEGRAMWERAAELGAEPVIAYRALGMAAKTLDGDLKTARTWLEKANQADPKDSIVARDLANVLFALADQADTDTAKHELVVEARDRLKGAFAEGRGRSDYAALLARSYNRLGDYAASAQMLDSVRVTVWEGAHEAHDLFEQAHLALGDAQLAAGYPAEALAEFNRALTYPENLATGRLETTCDAHIQFRRGQALAALGRKDEARVAWQLAVDSPSSNDPAREEARRQARAALQP
jgi:tetratricopeptide (TPR) repeat protein